MVKITSIKKKRSQIIIEVEKNGEVIPHITTEHILLKYHLEEGMSLKNDEYKRLIRENEFEILYLKAIHHISYQMRSISEVKKHLRKSTKDNTLIDSVIQELKQNKYLSDIHFVTEYVNEKIQFDLVGPTYIKDKLIQKGIHYDLIDDALVQFTEEMERQKIMDITHMINKPYRKVIDSMKRRYVNKGFHLRIIDSAILNRKDDILNQIDETSLLDVAFHKIKNDYNLDTYEGRQKCMQKLMRQGYSYDEVKRVVKEVNQW